MRARVRLCLLFALLCPLAASAQQALKGHQALIVATPVSMSFVRELTSEAPGEIAHGAVYQATLRLLKTAYGQFKRNGPLKVELTASHPESVTSHKQIFLLLDVADDGAVSVVWWGPIGWIACIPAEAKDQIRLRRDFGEFKSLDGDVCGYVKPTE